MSELSIPDRPQKRRHLTAPLAGQLLADTKTALAFVGVTVTGLPFRERRHVVPQVGLVEGRMLFLTYTMRDEVVRIICASGAEPHEKKYHEI